MLRVQLLWYKDKHMTIIIVLHLVHTLQISACTMVFTRTHGKPNQKKRRPIASSEGGPSLQKQLKLYKISKALSDLILHLRARASLLDMYTRPNNTTF